MTIREYTMTQRVLTRLLRARRVAELACHYPACDDPIEVDDQVISTLSRGGSRCNIYHKNCYRKTLLDV